MSGVDDEQTALRRDYERIALTGVKRVSTELDDAGLVWGDPTR